MYVVARLTNRFMYLILIDADTDLKQEKLFQAELYNYTLKFVGTAIVFALSYL